MAAAAAPAGCQRGRPSAAHRPCVPRRARHRHRPVLHQHVLWPPDGLGDDGVNTVSTHRLRPLPAAVARARAAERAVWPARKRRRPDGVRRCGHAAPRRRLRRHHPGAEDARPASGAGRAGAAPLVRRAHVLWDLLRRPAPPPDRPRREAPLPVRHGHRQADPAAPLQLGLEPRAALVRSGPRGGGRRLARRGAHGRRRRGAVARPRLVLAARSASPRCASSRCPRTTRRCTSSRGWACRR